MATSTGVGEDRSFSVGRIFSRTLALIGENPLAVFGVVLLFITLPDAAIHYGLALSGYAPRNMNSQPASLGITLLVSMFSWALSIVGQGALVGAAIASSEGRRARFSESVVPAVARLLPLIGAGLLYSVGLMIGAIALLIPFFFLWVRWAAVGPAMIAEGSGVNATFARSVALSAGVRGKIFGLQLVAGIVAGLFAVAFGFLSLAMFGEAVGQQEYTLNLAVAVVTAVGATLAMGFATAVQTMLYIELVEWTEGPATRVLGNIFA